MNCLPILLAISPATSGVLPAPSSSVSERPNVIVMMTDDQGWGDFGFHGHPVLRTPALDRLASESVRLDTFYVHPVCTPTRAALMTGRYPQRTRAFDTWVGRAMMDPAEVTVAEVLREAGWATGIFGKWHLGDCYPMRAMDQGFEESLVLRGGGIGQPADPEGGEGKYTDPVLFHNGIRRETKGYCTDVYFDAAIDWIEQQTKAERPFFVYLPTNAPHGPFKDVPRELYEKYKAMDLSPAFAAVEEGHALPTEFDADKLARIFAMIENVDQNVAKLNAALEDLGVVDNTLVLFLNDNGPNTRRAVGGMRGMKSHVHEGGVRSPLWARWPARLVAGVGRNEVAANIDLMPTILEACAVPLPDGLAIDGRSLMPLLERTKRMWDERTIVLQAHRGDEGVPYHNFMLRGARWKLLNATGFGKELDSVEPEFELYDLLADPLELHDLAAKEPRVLAELRAAYDRWFESVSTTRTDNWAPPRIVIGAPQAPHVTLTRQDWRKQTASGWAPNSQGTWHVEVARSGPYRVRVRALPSSEVESVRVICGEEVARADFPADTTEVWLEEVVLPLGPHALRFDLLTAEGAIGPYQVELLPPRD